MTGRSLNDGAGVRLRLPANHLSRRALGCWSAQAGLLAAVFPLVFGVLYLVLPVAGEIFGTAFFTTLIPGFGYVAIMPSWRYRTHRWELDSDLVYSVTGWAWQKWRIVPLSRVQTVDTHRGPLQQVFGLSGITVTTASASGAVKIDGLDLHTAAELVEQLARYTETEAKATR